MIVTFQLREDYATCEYPPWFLALCKEYEIDFDYVRMKTHWGNVWVWVMNKIHFWKVVRGRCPRVIWLYIYMYLFHSIKFLCHILWPYFSGIVLKPYFSVNILKETSSPSNNHFKPHPSVVCVMKGHCPKVNQPHHFMPTHKPSRLPISHILLKVYFSYSVTTFLWKYIYGETSMTSYGPPIVVCVVRAVVQKWFNRATLCRPINRRGFSPLLFSWSRQLAEPP